MSLEGNGLTLVVSDPSYTGATLAAAPMTIEVLPPTDGSASGVSERLIASASSALCLRDVTSTSSICVSGGSAESDCCAIERLYKPIASMKAPERRTAHVGA